MKLATTVIFQPRHYFLVTLVNLELRTLIVERGSFFNKVGVECDVAL